MRCSKSDSDSIEICVKLLKEAKVLVLPTDTVYGFSGIVGKTDAEIRKIKGRAETKPFIQLIANPEDLKSITDDKVPEILFSKWPGPLSIIVHEKNNPEKTVAVRCPGDLWLRKIIEKTGCPLYSTSVNRSGSPVLTDCDSIEKEFGKETALIVDNGKTENPVPSTIVMIEGDGFKVIREGAVKF